MTFYVPEEYWDSYKQYLDELDESEDFDAKYERYLASFHSIPEVYDVETYKLLMARFKNEHKRQLQMNESEESWESQKRYWDRYEKVHKPKPDLNGLTTDDLKEGQLNHYLKVDRLATLIDLAVRDKIKSELEDNLLFYPLGKKEVLRLLLAYTLTVIGVSIRLTIFVLTQMGKIS